MSKPLTSQQIKAAHLLAEGLSQREVAQKIGVGKSTIHKWTKIPLFAELIENVRQERLTEVSNALSQAREKYCDSVKDEQENYLEELRRVKERQKSWSAAVTEVGIRGISLVNNWLTLAEQTVNERNLTEKQTALLKIIPSYMKASAEMLRSASDAEDRAFALAELSQQLERFFVSKSDL